MKVERRQASDVAIVGAGPYGLSLAAHLAAGGVEHRIFGRPMQFWREHVPPGTCLKSDGKSSDLIDPANAWPLRAWHTERGAAFAVHRPIPVEEFSEYGDSFQNRFVPNLERCDIARIEPAGGLYRLTTQYGETALARRVVLAVGIDAFRHLPDMLAQLPGEQVSHSAAFGPVAQLAGQRVAVIGSGASAVDIAAVAQEAGADATIISSRPAIVFHPPPGPRKWRHRIMRPDTGIGAGWRHTFYVRGPDAFRVLPAAMRRRIVTSALGPSPGWFMKERIVGRVPMLCGQRVEAARLVGAQVRLTLSEGEFTADHVVAATGYHVDMARLGFLDPAIRAAIRTVAGAPVLSHRFETSMPGLHVIGPASAFSFGPVMRFVFGAGFAIPRLAGHLARASVRHSVHPAAALPGALATAS